MEDQIKIFVAGFKKWAKINKINQISLGKVISRHQSSVSAYFKNEARPDPELIQKWLDHYELEFDDILNIGREILSPPPNLKTQIREVLEEESRKAPKPELKKEITDIVDDLQMLFSLAPEELKEAHEIIKLKIKKLSQT